MSSLTDLGELVGFFSYSREDDADSQGALSALRTRIQGELRGQLGRTAKTFRLWQDKEAIPSGTLWEVEIKNAVGQSVFFIPIITPTVVASPYCQFELDSFLAREAELGRDDLVFPILYVDVPELQEAADKHPVLSLIAKRQYRDWREFRHLDANDTQVRREIARFCTDIRNALRRAWVTPAERAAALERDKADQADAARRAEDARQAAEAQARERDAAAQRQRQADADAKAEAEAEQRRQQEVDARRRDEERKERERQAEAERAAETERRNAEAQRRREQAAAAERAAPERPTAEPQQRGATPLWHALLLWPPTRSALIARCLIVVLILGLGALRLVSTTSRTTTPFEPNSATSTAPGSTTSTTPSPATSTTRVAPTLTIASTHVSTKQGEFVPLGITVKSSDPADHITITITGVPSSVTLSAGSHPDIQTWILTPEQLPGLTLTARSVTSATLTVTASNGTASASQNILLEVQRGRAPIAPSDAPSAPAPTTSDDSGLVGTWWAGSMTSPYGQDALFFHFLADHKVKYTWRYKSADSTFPPEASWANASWSVNGQNIHIKPEGTGSLDGEITGSLMRGSGEWGPRPAHWSWSVTKR